MDGDEELDWEAISAQVEDGDEEPDWEAIGAGLEAFELENPEEVAALAAVRAGAVLSSRNCRRRRDDTNDQHRHEDIIWWLPIDQLCYYLDSQSFHIL